MFAKPEPEMVHPDLYKKILDEGTDAILQNVKNYNAERKKLIHEVKKSIKISQAMKDEAFADKTAAVASDAGNNGVDLRSAFAPLYASVALATQGWRILGEPISKAGDAELWAGEYKPEDRESMLSMKIQFDITRQAIDKWNPEMVLFDGPLLLHYGLMPSIEATNEYWDGFKATAKSAMELLHVCYERKITIAGFVKRTRLNRIGQEFKDMFPEAEYLRDTALLDLVLRLGQYTLLEISPPKGGIVNQYREAAETLNLPNEETDELIEFHSAYLRSGFNTPYRVELPKFCLDQLPEACTMIYTTSEEDGIPFAIAEADKLTRITTTISNIRSLMLFSKALDLVKAGEMDMEDLNLLALQHGEAWALREDRFIQDVQSLSQGGQ
jgi:hypothetical protein